MKNLRFEGESLIGALVGAALFASSALLLSSSLTRLPTPAPTWQDSALVLTSIASRTTREPDVIGPDLDFKILAGVWTHRSSDRGTGMKLELRANGAFIARVQSGSDGAEIHALETSGMFTIQARNLVFRTLKGDPPVLGLDHRALVFSMPNSDWLILGPNPVTFKRELGATPG